MEKPRTDRNYRVLRTLLIIGSHSLLEFGAVALLQTDWSASWTLPDLSKPSYSQGEVLRSCNLLEPG